MSATFPDLQLFCEFDGDAGPTFYQSVLVGFPRLYYRMDDAAGGHTSATDASGNGLDATVDTTDGTLTWQQAGLLPGDPDSKAVLFNGAALKRAYTPNAADLAAFSFECIIKSATTPQSGYLVLLMGWDQWATIGASGGGTGGIHILRKYGQPYFPLGFGLYSPSSDNTYVAQLSVLDSNGNVQFLQGYTSLLDGNPHHLIATYDGAQMRLYVDGNREAQVDSVFTPAIPTSPNFVIGDAPSSTSPSSYLGVMDEAAFYPGAFFTDDAAAYHHEAMQVKVNPTDTDISSYVRAFSCKRGKQYELDATDAGTGTVTLADTGRDFEPGYPSSPFYPNVVPMKRMIVQAEFQNVIYPLMVGRVERWPEDWVYGTDYSEPQVDLVDAFDDLNADEGISVNAPTELSGARMKRVLQATGWDAGNTLIDPGLSLCAAKQMDQENALNHAQTVEATESGFFFISASGTPTFKDRQTLVTMAQTSGSGLPTFTDDGSTALAYTKLKPVYDRDRIINYPKVTGDTGNVQVTGNAHSERMYRRRSTDITTLDVTDAAARDHSAFLSILFGQPILHWDTMECVIGDGSDPQLISTLLNLELGQLIVVKRTPTPGHTIQQTCLIEQIAWDCKPGLWTCSVALGPAPGAQATPQDPVGANGYDFWLLGSSALGTETYLAY